MRISSIPSTPVLDRIAAGVDVDSPARDERSACLRRTLLLRAVALAARPRDWSSRTRASTPAPPLKRTGPTPAPHGHDPMVWIVLAQMCRNWARRVDSRSDDNVMRWHRGGCAALDTHQTERWSADPISREIERCCYKMATANPLGARNEPRELRKLGSTSGAHGLAADPHHDRPPSRRGARSDESRGRPSPQSILHSAEHDGRVSFFLVILVARAPACRHAT